MNKTMQTYTKHVSMERGLESNSTATKGAGHSRRRFIKMNLLGLALAPSAGLLLSEEAWAVKRDNGEPAKLDDQDSQARALEYTVVTSKSEQSCANCQLYTGAGGATWGSCALFSYRRDTRTGKPLQVSAKGWCRGWEPRRG